MQPADACAPREERLGHEALSGESTLRCMPGFCFLPNEAMIFEVDQRIGRSLWVFLLAASVLPLWPKQG